MKAGSLSCLAVAVSMMSFAACSPSEEGDSKKLDVARPPADEATALADRLMNRAWKVTAPTDRAPGSFYIFLSDGTLVMTSCVETYRLATWRSQTGSRLEIAEDQATRYEAEIQELTEQHLRLRLELRNEKVELALEPASAPYVCPDLRR